MTSAQSHSHLDREVRAGLSRFLAACDQVKFAGYRPEQGESEATLALAEELLSGQEQHLRAVESRTREEAA